MPVNPYYERLKSSGFGWLIYGFLIAVIAGIVLIAVGLTIAPGPLFLVGILVLGTGIWGVYPLFADATKRSSPRRKIPNAVRMEVWRKYIGDKPKGTCYACGKQITWDDFEAGHNIAAAKGGRLTVANLRPICGSCNKAMGTGSIEAYKRKLTGTATRLGAERSTRRRGRR